METIKWQSKAKQSKAKIQVLWLVVKQKLLNSNKGFTLVELSIVMVIIGLIVGGVLMGEDLISAAEVRGQISQIERYNTAVRTFQIKYDGLPGDLSADKVTAFGFTATPTRAGTSCRGDGNGILETYSYYSGNPARGYSGAISSETAWFWEDLSTNSGLIEGNFNSATDAVMPYDISEISAIKIKDIIPYSKFSGVYLDAYANNGINYFSLLGFGPSSFIDRNGTIRFNKTMLTVSKAYAIDKKIDDGFPQTGVVTAKYQQWDIALNEGGGTTSVNKGLVWASGDYKATGSLTQGTPDTSATPASATTCYDNANVAGAVQQYSNAQSAGNNLNCALSFKMQ